MADVSHTEYIAWLTELSVTQMLASDMDFQEFLKLFNTHAHTVDTKRSFSPSPQHQEPSQLAKYPLHEVLFTAHKLHALSLFSLVNSPWIDTAYFTDKPQAQ